MSSTRTATDGILHQERYCSAPELQGEGINGLAAAKRIRIIDDGSVREILWFIQSQSLQTRGLQRLCDELISAFPERVGTPMLRKLAISKRRTIKRSEIWKLRTECGLDHDETLAAMLGRDFDFDDIPIREWEIDFYNSHVREAATELPAILTDFCLNPKKDIRHGIWFFDDLYGALVTLRTRSIEEANQKLADTVASREINETLNFWRSRRRTMVLIEGVPGIGRSLTAECWVAAQAGMVRFVEVPSSNDDRSFFVSIARQLGVAHGASMKAQEIKVRIEEILASSELMLAFDESQYLWAQYLRPRKTPDRLLWIKSVFDSGTPIALIALTDFSAWQAHYVERTLWADEQFEGRLNRAIVLVPQAFVADMLKKRKLVVEGLNRRLVEISTPDLQRDMLKIARSLFPEGERRSWELLASYALAAPKKLARGIREALESASYRAEKDKRARIAYRDIEAALTYDHGFLKLLAADGEEQNDKALARSLKRRRCGDLHVPILAV